ncbi:MAG: erythromycin esterase family protein, partial [Dehalococcoidia bacterium]
MVRTLALLLILLLSVSACDRRQPRDVASQERGDTTGTPASTTSTGTPTSTPTPEAAAAADIPPEATAWLKQHAIPFATSKPETGFDDLQPLKRVIGDARIVALGEATHGTHELFEMKHRMLEFLVEEMGFNTFAIEATWPESNLVNDYVHTGQGDPAKLLSGLYFWTWNTQQVLDMILWMRRHNENPGNAPKVSFFGFDMQQPRMAMQNVIDYLTPLDADAAER